MIGKIKRVPIRSVWKHEAYDFTTWMEDNIDVLNEVLDITLVSIERERKTESAFSVDLVGEDEDGQVVIIENQLDKSDHKHLGQLITYLTAMQAKTAIWIVSDPRPEHVVAMTRLNESGMARFHLLKVEAIQIEDSAPAPLLTVIVEPPEDNLLRGEQRQQDTERHRIRLKWWTDLVSRPAADLHKHITPGGYSYIGTSAGYRGLNFNYTITQNKNAVELYIDRGAEQGRHNRAIYDALYQHKEAITSQFDYDLLWQSLEAKRACRIKAEFDGGYRSEPADWARIQSNSADAMSHFGQVMKHYLQEIDINTLIDRLDAEEEEDQRPSPS